MLPLVVQLQLGRHPTIRIENERILVCYMRLHRAGNPIRRSPRLTVHYGCGTKTIQCNNATHVACHLPCAGSHTKKSE